MQGDEFHGYEPERQRNRPWWRGSWPNLCFFGTFLIIILYFAWLLNQIGSPKATTFDVLQTTKLTLQSKEMAPALRMSLIQNLTQSDVQMAMFCDGVDVAQARKANAAGADLSTVCLAKELKKCAVLHPTKLRSLDPAYSDCAKAAFSAHGRSFEYCQFAFGRHANTSGIYKHAQIVKNIQQNENYPQLAWMEKCYHNEGDSHYREYC